MEKIYTIVGAYEDIGEPSKFDVIGNYRSIDNAKKAMDDHIRSIFSKVVPEDELDEFIIVNIVQMILGFMMMTMVLLPFSK